MRFHELTFLGPACETRSRRLPLMEVTWLEDRPRAACPVLMGRNGRPRGAVTMPGYQKGVKPLNAGRKFAPEPLSDAEMLRLLAVIPVNTKAGVRNRALYTLLWRTGLRISEALDLLPHHVDFDTKRVTVLCGKGSKRRTVGVDDGALAAVSPWLIERAMLRIVPTAPLFCTIQKPAMGGHIYPAYARHALHKYAAQAGISKRVHPHALRHALAVSLIREGFGLTDVQSQLGHNNPATTAIYLRTLGADEAFERIAGRVMPGSAS